MHTHYATRPALTSGADFVATRDRWDVGTVLCGEKRGHHAHWATLGKSGWILSKPNRLSRGCKWRLPPRLDLGCMEEAHYGRGLEGLSTQGQVLHQQAGPPK